MVFFAKIVKVFQPLTIFAKISVLHVSQSSEYTSISKDVVKGYPVDTLRRLYNVADIVVETTYRC